MSKELDAMLAELEQSKFGAERPSVGTKEYLLNELKKGAAGSVGGVLDTAPRAINLVGAGLGTALRTAGAPESVIPEWEQYLDPNASTKILEGVLGTQDLKAPDGGTRILGGVARGIGSMAVPIGGSIKALVGQALAAMGGGAGAEAAGELTKDNPWAMLAGGLAGGVLAPSILNAPERWRQLKAAMPSRSATSKTASNIVEKMVDRTIKSDVAGVPGAVENIDEATALALKIPGFKPSVGEAANAPALTGMQANYAKLSPANLNAEIARQEGNLKAIESYLKSATPQQAQQASSVRSAVNQRIAALRDNLQKQGAAVAAKVPEADQLAVGSKLTTAAQAEKAAARPVIAAAYQKAFDAAGDAPIDLKPIIAKAEDILGTRLSQIKPDVAPETVRALSAMEQGSGATLKQLDEIRKAINADLASAGRSLSPIAPTRLRNLSQLHEEIDAAVKGSAIPEGAKTAYADALNKYREEFVPRFKEGANLRMFRESSAGEPRILPDKVASTYFTTDAQGGQTRAGQFAALFGKNQEARASAREGIFGLYRQKVIDPTTGLVNVEAHNRFLRDHANTLSAYKFHGVNVVDDFRAIGAEAAKVSNANERFTSLAKQLKFDTVDELATEALKSPKVMGNVKLMLNEGQRDTFAKMLMDKAWEHGSSAGMGKFLEDNAQTLKMVLSPKHLSDLKDVTKALSIAERAPKVGHLATSGEDALKRGTGVSLATVYAQMRATTAGRQAPVTGAFNIATPMLTRMTQTQFDDVMRQALYDPQTAQNLRNFLTASPAQGPGAASRLLSGLKTGAGVLWDAKGPIFKFTTGASSYPTNLARSGQTTAGAVRDREE